MFGKQKHQVHVSAIFLTVVVSVFSAAFLSAGECGIHITLDVDEGTPYDTASGVVTGIDPDEIFVVCYVRTSQWWPQPTGGSRFIEADPVTGEYELPVDHHPERQIMVFVIRKEYQGQVPAVEYVHASLPLYVDCENILAVAAWPTIQFAGRSWAVKGGEYLGPSGDGDGNFFSTDHVWIDGDGLHLLFAYDDEQERWECAEVYLLTPLGYGTYHFRTGSRIDQLPPKMYASPFLYQAIEGTVFREIDIEFTKAGLPSRENAQYAIQPDIFEYFDIELESDLSSHTIGWSEGAVFFRSWQGHGIHPTADSVIHHWTSSGPHVPEECEETVHLNLWVIDKEEPGISQGETVEFIISDFSFYESIPHLITGPGPSFSNHPLVRTGHMQWYAYGAPRGGVKVASGDLQGDGVSEIITGAGPVRVYGPHVRGFDCCGNPIPGVSFLAYGTHRWGINVCCGDLDGDGDDEIITGAGPGSVFGPHVRGWDYDGSGISPIPGLSYFAYGTHRWGVNAACGDIDGDGIDEIVTGAGPGAVFGPHVRGWNYDGAGLEAITGVSFLAYGTNRWGVNVACGDLDGDGTDEIITGPGPGPEFIPHVRGWSYDRTGNTTRTLLDVNFNAYGGSGDTDFAGGSVRHGVNVTCGDIDDDGKDEILTMPGPDAGAPAWVRAWNANGGLELVPQVNFDAYGDAGYLHGGNAAWLESSLEEEHF